MHRLFLLLFCLVAGAAAADPTPDVVLASVDATEPPAEEGRRCTRDGAVCIEQANYVADVCRVIEAAAVDAKVDRNFFARLIWRESLFDAAAVSPVGAQGIAQFMPETAKLRGLGDSFNPAEALFASAAYLADLTKSFGNIGLAAVAYNGGEARAARFVGDGGGLPDKTRAYVLAITGYSAEVWRDKPPESVDLALKGADFQTGCTTMATKRTLREMAPKLSPWGVVIASNRDRDGAERQVERLMNRHRALLGGETVNYSRNRRPGMPGRLNYAQVGRDTREAAEALCGRLRGVGADCMVLKN